MRMGMGAVVFVALQAGVLTRDRAVRQNRARSLGRGEIPRIPSVLLETGWSVGALHK